MRRAQMFAARKAPVGEPIRLGEVFALVVEATAAALIHAERGERGAAVTLLIALDGGCNHPHPRLRRFLRAQVRRVERALGLEHVEEMDAAHAL